MHLCCSRRSRGGKPYHAGPLCVPRPVAAAQVKVSNPVQLAQTLGGKHLYGQGAFAPIRELLQNSIDAVRARRHLEGRDQSWGEIKLTLESVPSHTGDDIWLHVDDTGVGMSERVLTGTLLDFGRSLWNSPLLHEEFPGLDSQGMRPIGKFGIGFFSIFVLGQNIKVVSRPFRGSSADSRVLEFSSIETRPILREADPEELPNDVMTRVSVRIDDIENISKDINEENYTDIYKMSRYEENIHHTISNDLKRLISAVDVDIDLRDGVEGFEYTHENEWQNVDREIFLSELLSEMGVDAAAYMIKIHKNLLCDLESPEGISYGRAALLMVSKDDFSRVWNFFCISRRIGSQVRRFKDKTVYC